MGSTPDNTAPVRAATTPVKSGSGAPVITGVNAAAVSAGDFAYGSLGSGTAGGMGNAALLSTTTILPNTKRTQISKAAMEAADKNYTTQMNLLSQHWSVGDTSSPSYEAQKLAAMNSQYNWELARNNLEETAVTERQAIIEAGDLPTIPVSAIDTTAATPDLSQTNDIVVNGTPSKDNRIRLRPKQANGSTFPLFGDKDSVLYLLNATGGAFFPYTPTITMSHKATYSEQSPVHANTDYHLYNNTPAVQIQIQGDFTAQNLDEAQYTLACMHFFRTSTKMHFGVNDPNAGLPPPMLVLSGYGEFMFNDLDVILTDFSMELPNGVDYMEVTIGGNVAWVPVKTTMSVSLIVQQTPAKQRDEFNFDQFASGEMFSNQRGWI